MRRDVLYHSSLRRGPAAVLLIVLFAGVLYASSLYSYLLFHALVELFSVVVAFVIFTVAWHTRQIQDNRYLLFIGIASVFTGFLDLLHALAYQGMGVFSGYGADLPTQLWIAFRYLFSISFLLAPFFVSRKVGAAQTAAAYSVVTFVLVYAVFSGRFPVCFVEGNGLTSFKIISEYVICGIFLASLVLLFRKRESFDVSVFRLLAASIASSAASELSFTLYVAVFGPANMIGHFFLLGSVVFIYRAIVITGIVRPSSLLFRNLAMNEAALKDSESRYRALFENMMGGFAYHKIIMDEGGKPTDYIFLEVNNAFERLTGLKRDDIIGKKVTEVLPGIEKDSADWIGTYGRVAITGQGVRFEQHSVALDKWYSVAAYSPAKGYFVAVFDDITERKTAEEALRTSESKYRELVQNANSAIIRWKSDGTITFFNEYAQTFFGYSFEEVIGKSVTFLVPERESTGADLTRLFQDIVKQPSRYENNVNENVRRDGSRVWMSWTNKPIFDEQGNVAEVLAVGIDITGLKAAEEAIVKLNTDLERRNRELWEVNTELESFVYSVSHDLRSPLRSISGFATFLEEDYAGHIDDKGRDYLSRIRKGAEKMSRLIEDLLRLSGVSRQEIERATINISGLVSSVVSNLSEADPGRKVSVTVQAGLTALADPHLMEIALSNLFGNAWKFTKKTANAGIEFGSVEMEGKTVYYVRDNGAGFSQENNDKMFRPFQRLHSDEEFEGTGIGLAVVERIIRRHGGRIWAEGAKGRGATFFFTLD